MGTAIWRMDAMDALFRNILGDSFVIRRGENENSGCAQKGKLSQLLRKSKQRSRKIMPLGHTANQSPSAAAVLLQAQPSSISIFDITELLSPLSSPPWQEAKDNMTDSVPSSSSSAPAYAMSAPPLPLSSLDPADEASESTSPRRTIKCGFTCLRCQKRTYRMINPRSFSEGTLVVQCSNSSCLEWHKLADHLGLFGEPSGYPDSLQLPLPPFYWKQ